MVSSTCLKAALRNCIVTGLDRSSFNSGLDADKRDLWRSPM
jgi:hypothetical protein